MILHRKSAITAEQVRALAAFVEKAIQDEREACAAIAESFAAGPDTAVALEIASRIRGRRPPEDIVAAAVRSGGG